MRPLPRWLLLCILLPALALLARRASSRAGGSGALPPAPPLTMAGPAAPVVEARRAPVLPLGSVHAAVETAAGWVVLDARASRLVWLDSLGAPLRVAGREGRGPGEMADPAGLAAVEEGVLVLETLGGPAHLFDTLGAFRERIPAPAGACPGGPLAGLSAGTDALFVLRTCPGPDGLLRAHLERWEPGGATRPVHQEVLEDLRATISPFRRPSVAALRGGVAYGVAHDACALVLGVGGAREVLCPPDEDRPPVPDEAVDRVREVLAGRARSAGLRLVVPERAAPFERVVAAGGRAAFVVRPREGVLAVDVLGEDGRLRRLAVEGADRVFTGERTLLAVRETLEGPAVTVVPLP